MLTLSKITRLAAAQKFAVLLDEICRNGRPRVNGGALGSEIAATREYAITPGALPLAALGLGLRRCVELSWTVDGVVVELADALGQRVCTLAALRCRGVATISPVTPGDANVSRPATAFPARLTESLSHAVAGLGALVHHCEQTHAEIDQAAWSRLTSALEIGRMLLAGEGTFMSPARALQLAERTGREGAGGERSAGERSNRAA